MIWRTRHAVSDWTGTGWRAAYPRERSGRTHTLGGTGAWATESPARPVPGCRISVAGDGRAAVTGPQPHHHGCHRDEHRSGDDAGDDITGEHGYRYAEGDCDAG